MYSKWKFVRLVMLAIMAVVVKSKRTEPRLSKAIYAERTASRRTIPA